MSNCRHIICSKFDRFTDDSHLTDSQSKNASQDISNFDISVAKKSLEEKSGVPKLNTNTPSICYSSPSEARKSKVVPMGKKKTALSSTWFMFEV